MSQAHLNLERSGQRAVITLDRPRRRNALHGPLWTALRETALALAADPPRVVIVTGAGGHFCSGMDLRMDNPLIQELAPAVLSGDASALEALITMLKGCFGALRQIGSPLVAAIEGSCIGGGLELALACDMRVAARTARLSLPETRHGLVPDVGGITRLTQLIGSARATDLILTARTISGEEAHEWGLVDRLCEEGEALAAAHALADTIQQQAPQSSRCALSVIRAIDGLSEAEALALETQAGVQTLISGEAIEGLQAFAERRPPSWATE